MATVKLPPVPVSAPMVDENGKITPVWLDFFQKLFDRVGGSLGT